MLPVSMDLNNICLLTASKCASSVSIFHLDFQLIQLRASSDICDSTCTTAFLNFSKSRKGKKKEESFLKRKITPIKKEEDFPMVPESPTPKRALESFGSCPHLQAKTQSSGTKSNVLSTTSPCNLYYGPQKDLQYLRFIISSSTINAISKGKTL